MAFSIQIFVLLLVCLFANAARKQRVIRGEQARPHEFKSIVSMQYMSGGGYSHYCAGTLIDSRTVLTAAHCKLGRGSLRVVAGLHVRSQMNGGVQVAKVMQEKPHRSFSFGTFTHDIMILKLASPIRPSSTVEFVRLPTQVGLFPPARTDCTLAGWGKTSVASAASNVLMKGPLTAVKVNPPNTNAGMRRDSSIIYAKPAGPHQTSGCKGDSGGPLYCPANDGGAPFQVGIVSGGKGICGPRNEYARFARVSNELQWINANK